MQRIIKLLIFNLIILVNVGSLEAKVYKGAEYRTNESYLYGRFEVRYKPANREGVVSSFFTYHDYEDSTGWNEIDFEFIGRYSNSIQFNTITPGQRFHIRTQHIEFDAYEDFHDYAFEWTPDYVAWFIDGEEVYRQTGDHISTLQYPQQIMMNIWNPIYTNWVGYFDKVLLPAVSIYDYVQYSSYTPGTGNHGNDNNFTIEWKDDFDNFDSDRWSKATHTFPGNEADFDPDNVIFKDGYLHLYLTNEFEKGGVDNFPPKVLWARANYDSSITLKLSEEITKLSGESIGNYILPGSNIKSAELSNNKVYVRLQTENYNPYAINNLIYSGLTDLSINSNVSPNQVTSISKVDSISFPIKVNVGGDIYNDYLADQEWSYNSQYGYWMGDVNTYSQTLDIQDTDDDELFRTEREGLITYKFKLPNGNYNISFLITDNKNDSPGENIFNILAENQIVQKDIDIMSLVEKGQYYLVTAQIEVQDGILDIYFEEVVDSAFVNAIIIERIITSNDEENNSDLFNQFGLYQNYPNPFNPTTQINYSLMERSQISLEVYDLLGNKVKSLVDGIKNAGNHNVNFDASHYPSGVYFYRLSANSNNILTKKMILLK